ncbi:MAG: FISUMP domain-containing protein [Bacteroidota bacterium]|nr:FISUMP domain-containing protein [Bacteroidota bacterium]
MKKIKNGNFVGLLITAALLFYLTGCNKHEDQVITDVEGNVYRTVTIGSQVWMAENLKTRLFNDSTRINLVTSATTWTSTTNPAYCWYNNDTLNRSVYGAIYNWFAVRSGKLCPTGWHVPGHDEFKILEMSLGMTKEEADSLGWRGTDQGTKLKSRTGWDNNGNGTNRSGFSALPGGYRYGANGAFYNLGELSYWWSSSEKSATLGLYRRLDGNESKVYAEGVRKQAGKYVRCVKNPS